MEKEKSILEKIQENSTQDIMSVIYGKINELFGSGNQLFAMEFPARPLNSKDYEYTTDDCYSNLTKPYPVQEAEFALSDQLFDISPIVQGPNGEKLSTVFSTTINNYVPKLQGLKGFVSDKKYLRQWLMTHVSEDINGTEKSISRMALSKELYGDFLEQRNKWYKDKNNKYDEMKKNGDLDGYSRWLSSEGLVAEEEVNNLYNDSVVRGHYHEVLTLLGFLNVSSPAEVLEDTKQKMRASLRRSLDGSSNIYTVQLQPSDWFKSLRPNISPKDLTMTTESLIADYKAKKNRLRSLQAQLSEISIIEISADQQAELQSEISEYEKQLSDAELQLINSYGKGTVEAVKSAINIYKAVSPEINPAEVISDLNNAQSKSLMKSNVLELLGDIAPSIMESIAKTYSDQSDILHKHKELTESMMAYADAKVKDKRLLKLRLEEQINIVQDDLDFLSPLVTGVITEQEKQSRKSKSKPDDKDNTVESDEETLMTDTLSDNSTNFMDVIIKSDENGSFSSNQSSASAESKSWGTGGWFWSGAKKSSSSSSTDTKEKLEINKSLEIGFRAQKVTFERGGWFNPNIFKLSNNYYRLADIRCNGDICKSDVLNVKNEKELKELKTYHSSNDNKQIDYLLPAFPSSFIIAKDITIRIKSNKAESKATKEYMQKSQSSGGGVFCFRGNSSKSVTNSSETAYFGNSDQYFYIRIPGPQILGWFLEFTAKDNSAPYEKLDFSAYTDALNALVKEDNNINKSTEEK